jgi:hypothetical protein
VVLEYLAVCDLPIGPWDGQSAFCCIKHTAEKMHGMLDSSCELRPLLYPRCCSYDGSSLDADFGTQDHIDRKWDEVWAKSCFKRQSTKVNLCRWMSIWDARDDLMQNQSARCM